jgi:hypothetical protein
VTGAVVALGLFAADAATDPTSDVTAIFLQYGVVGVLALLGLWFFKTAYQDVVKQRDAARAEVSQLTRDMLDKVVPVLGRAVDVMDDVTDELRGRR